MRLTLALCVLAPFAAAMLDDGPVGAEPVLVGVPGAPGQVEAVTGVKLTPGGLHQLLLSSAGSNQVLAINGMPTQWSGQPIPSGGFTIYAGLFGGDQNGAGTVNAAAQLCTVVPYAVASNQVQTAVLVDNVLQLDFDDLVAATGLPADARWRGIGSAEFDGQGRVIVGGHIEDFTVNLIFEMAYVRYDVAPDGSFSNGELIVGSGQTLANGWDVDLLSTSQPLRHALSDAGDLLVYTSLRTGDLPPFRHALLRNQEVLMMTGEPSPVPGRNWIVWPVLDYVNQDGAGNWAALTRIDAPVASDRVLVRNGELYARKGDPLPGRPGTELITLGVPQLADNGNMLWSASFLDGALEREALLLNDQILVETNVTTADGVRVIGIGAGSDGYDISADGTSVVFQGLTLEDGWRAYLVEVGPWVSLGQSLPAGALAPKFVGTGTLEPGSNARVELRDGLPLANAWMVLGLSELNAAFKGGVMCPAVDVLLGPFSLDASGEFGANFNFPAGVPSGTELFLQGWVSDPSGPLGFSASNCMLATTP
ncbi:MAG: hypothetical protein DHS20C15_29080 [Planctomycetota bacterium]|nr:MAG: hypothetical protein DHS20C15_29080 [Planctomycetota bacterium]